MAGVTGSNPVEPTEKKLFNKGGEMTREEFDRIAVKEGILAKDLRDSLWEGKPPDDLDEEKLRETFQWLKKTFEGKFPWLFKEEEGSF